MRRVLMGCVRGLDSVFQCTDALSRARGGYMGWCIC